MTLIAAIPLTTKKTASHNNQGSKPLRGHCITKAGGQHLSNASIAAEGHDCKCPEPKEGLGFRSKSKDPVEDHCKQRSSSTDLEHCRRIG